MTLADAPSSDAARSPRRPRREVGEVAPVVVLPAIDGTTFDAAALAGRRYMLSFYRFASCPFCNLRVRQLVERYPELPERFSMVAVFDSPLENLRRHASQHRSPFPIVADQAGRYYALFGIEQSVAGVIKGMVTRAPTLIRAMAHGYVPTSLAGSLTTMPADFLIDEHGVIRVAHYGRDEGDHLPFQRVLAFASGGAGRDR